MWLAQLQEASRPDPVVDGQAAGKIYTVGGQVRICLPCSIKLCYARSCTFTKFTCLIEFMASNLEIWAI